MVLPDQIRKQKADIAAHFSSTSPTPPSSGTAELEEVNGEQTHIETLPEPEVVTGSSPEQGEDPNSETYQQRYRTLQGIHNAETQRMNAANRAAMERVEQLERLLASLPDPSAQPYPPPRHEEPNTYVSEQDRAEYGESIEVMRRAALEEVSPVMARLAQMEAQFGNLVSSINTNVVPQVQHVAQRQAETSQEAFWRNLETAVPNWKQINNDPDFQGWLLEVDPLTGTTRQAYLEQAQHSLNHSRVAAFFDTYSSLTGKYKPNASAQPSRSAQLTELEKQVAPGRSRSSSAPTGQVSKTYTPVQIKEFFDNVRTGKYKGREDERNRIERDIFAAQREGRIVANA